MEVSIFLAKVLGLYFIITCLAVLINYKAVGKIIQAMAKDVSGVFFEGFIALIIGLLIVVSHNIWTTDWRLIITIIGWITIVKGVARILAPNKVVTWGLKVYNRMAPVTFIVLLTAGVYLTYIGFTA